MNNWCYIALIAILFASCSRSDNEQLPLDEMGEDDGIVEMIPVSMEGYDVGTTRASGDIPLEDYDWLNPEEYPYDTPHDLSPRTFEAGDLLYILQKTPSLSTLFPATNETWTPESLKQKYGNYLSVYQYQENQDATWESAYNFVPYEDNSKDYALDWQKVRQNGSDGNAYKFYAYFFPVENKPAIEKLTSNPSKSDLGLKLNDYTLRTSQWPSNSLWQTSQQYDIRGAYHATPSLYSRMRLRLHHLMCYVRVTLYVPVMKERRNSDDPKYDGNQPDEVVGYSGFDENAFENNNGNESGGSFGGTRGQPGVYIGSGGNGGIGLGGSKVIAVNYGIDYTHPLTSDTDAPYVSPVYGGTTSNPAGVSMYLHRELYNEADEQEGKKNNGQSPVFQIDKSEFMSVDESDRYDEVRRYEFSAYIPTQLADWMYGTNNPNKYILYMTLKTPGTPPMTGDSNNTQPSDGTYKYFTYKASQNTTDKTWNINFTQGTLQHFYLYVPRSNNQTILIKANVDPWQTTVTDMTVMEEESQEN